MNQSVRKSNSISRYIYFGLTIIFFTCLILQVLFVGLALFDSSVHWLKHITLVHLFGFNIPVFMLLFAFLGRMPRWSYWYILGLLGLVFAMYFTANMTISWIGSLHPVIAILLIEISFMNVVRTWKWLKRVKQKGEK
ncbi:DUF6220 domain-containing protein [Ornithinibacillus salinisoli]|uniref:DUF6220 domain-containing protein n=1 Tax=Ornithinibacillus salinisoli TaxID=1848459 RepID=A0ABW4VX32_9BACI